MVKIQFNELKVDYMLRSSGVFAGDNVITKWKAFNISHEGFGSLSGDDNVTTNVKNLVIKTEDTPDDL